MCFYDYNIFMFIYAQPCIARVEFSGSNENNTHTLINEVEFIISFFFFI